MVTQQTAINTARAFVRECKEIGLTFDRVLLFGSYAKGTANEDSDIDLLLISKKFSDDVFGNNKALFKSEYTVSISGNPPVLI